MASKEKDKDKGKDKPKGKGQLPLPEPEQAPEPALLDQALAIALGALWRYKEEILAVALITGGVLTLLALLDLAGGALLGPWAQALTAAFGWGAGFVALGLIALGGQLLWREVTGRVQLPAGRVIAAEIAFFAGLALLYLLVAPGMEFNTTPAGVFGWALAVTLAQQLGSWPAGALLLVVCLLATLVMLGVSREGVSLALVRFSGGLRRAATGEAAVVPAPVSALAVREPAPARGGANAEPPAPAERKTPRAARIETAAAAGSASGNGAAAPAKAETPAKAEKPKARAPKEKAPVVSVAAKNERPAKARPRDERLPPFDLLDAGSQSAVNEAELREKEAIIVQTLAHFGLPAKVVSVRQGPAVTQFGVEPGFIERPGTDGQPRLHKVRVNQIATLSSDLALALSAQSLRIEAPVPGHSYVGIEVPNRKVTYVSLRGVIESDAFQKINAPLAIALGRDMSGGAVATDLGKMPHLLIAGTTGSGKSVCIATIITSLVCNNTPGDLRLVLIDPKLVELSRFNGLPHLLGQVENKLERITAVLRWVTQEMDNRYKLFAEIQARHLADYNRKIGRRRESERLPHIVVIVDELADLMLQSPIETEQTLCRLAQMARATGIHLVVATQRPSTDVVTGLIKANFPARASFAVASSIDSRVILDTVGAETLLGRGDMLFLAPDASAPVRLQGCLVTDKEVEHVVGYWRKQHEAELAARAAELTEELRAEDEEAEAVAPDVIGDQSPWEHLVRAKAEDGSEESPDDDLLARAVEVIRVSGHASASLLQRRLRIGYPRAARLMDELEKGGYIGGSVTGGKTRSVLRRLENGEGDEDED
jgi:S-DNA-T family DNA segregation ATPase FtsK/SpoIIIE